MIVDHNSDAGGPPDRAFRGRGVERRGIARRLFETVSLQSVDMALRIVQQLLIVPVLIGHWGVDLFQDWVVLMAAANCCLLLDFGMQTYFVNSMLFAWTKQDHLAYRRKVAIAMAAYGAVLPIAALLIVAGGTVWSWPALLGVRSMTSASAYWTGGTYLASLFVLMPLGIFTGIYRVRGDYKYSVVVGMLTQTFTGFAVCAIALAGGTPVACGVMYLLVNGLAWAGVALDQKRRYGEFPLRVSAPKREELWAAVGQSSQYAAPAMATPFALHFPVVLLGIWAPPGAAISYTVARTLAGLIRQITLQPNLPVGVELAKFYAHGDAAGLRRLYAAAAHLTCGVVGLLGGFILVAAGPIILIWTHNQVAYDFRLIAVIVATVGLMAPAQVPLILFQHINRPRILVLSNLAYLAGTAILCFVLVRPLSALGAALSTGIAEVAFVGTFVPFGASRLISLPIGDYFRNCIGILLICGGLASAAAWAALSVVPVRGIVEFVAFGVIWTAIVAVPGFYLVLTPEMRRHVQRYLADRFGRPSGVDGRDRAK
jgi:O-antigen/teichoic acid export membrane protein